LNVLRRYVVDPKTALTPFDLILADLHLSQGISGGEVIPYNIEVTIRSEEEQDDERQ
jgi:hypothetical protein